jgi:hypothetical protein
LKKLTEAIKNRPRTRSSCLNLTSNSVSNEEKAKSQPEPPKQAKSSNLVLKARKNLSNGKVSKLSVCLRNRRIKQPPISHKRQNKPDLAAKRPFDLAAMLDTKQVALKFKQIVRAGRISEAKVARQVGLVSPSRLNVLLNHAKAWEKCSDIEKRLYLKLDRISQSKEEIRSIQNSCGFKQHSLASLDKNNRPLHIDLPRLIEKLNGLFVRHRVMQGKLAVNYLGISPAQLSSLLNHPMSWRLCTENRKNIYRSLYEWTLSFAKDNS